MNISVNLTYIENLAANLCGMHQKIKEVECEFLNIRYKLDDEIQKDMNTILLKNEIEKDLQSIANDVERYYEFMEETVQAYKKAENKILKIGHQALQIKGLSKHKDIKTINASKIKRENSESQSDIALITNTIRICKLPKKDIYTQSVIKAGIISEGKNIHIRAWIK